MKNITRLNINADIESEKNKKIIIPEIWKEINQHAKRGFEKSH